MRLACYLSTTLLNVETPVILNPSHTSTVVPHLPVTFTFSHLADALIQRDLQYKYRDILPKASRVKSALPKDTMLFCTAGNRTNNLLINSPTP